MEKKFRNVFKRQWEKFSDKSDDIKLINWFEWTNHDIFRVKKATVLQLREMTYPTNRWKLSRSQSIYRKSCTHQRKSFPPHILFFLSFSFFYLICTQNEFTTYGWWVNTIHSSEYTLSSFRRAAIKCNRMNRIKMKNSPFGIWNLNMIHFPFHFQWWPLWLSTA